MHLSADISAVRIKKSNLCSDAQLNVEKAAEVIVPQMREGANTKGKVCAEGRKSRK